LGGADDLRDTLLRGDVAEHRALLLIVSAHAHLFDYF
jgi:hypothetical protein